MPLHLWKRENAHMRDKRLVSEPRSRIETFTGKKASDAARMPVQAQASHLHRTKRLTLSRRDGPIQM